MLVALDKSGKPVSVDNIKPRRVYKCPACGKEVTLYKGRYYVNQFRHVNGIYADRLEHPDTEWTKAWKDQVPILNREVVIEKDGVAHKADIQIGEYVIILSNYAITRKEFNDKTAFFRSAGYKVVWIFNMIGYIQYHKIKVEETGDMDPVRINWYWTYPRSFLADFNPDNNDGVTVLFQMYKEQFDNPCAMYLYKIIKLSHAEGKESLRRFKTRCIPQNMQELFDMIEEKVL